ncbi:MAG: Fic family protein [Candidatus Kerfeldbacteria bacterium]|nr:Fic family protein [Candidatus Kerfeldbacteria bacterium]
MIRARTLIAELRGLSLTLPNPLLLISPAVIRESIASSQIENINTTVQEVLQSQLFPLDEQRSVDKEVLRYREAVLWGFKHKRLPISTRLILGIHEKLIPSGGGQYRKQQNKIEDSTTHEVLYTPPIAPDVPMLMSDWENTANQQTEDPDPLLRCAMLHYQFEAIHPFLDGNGRTGRILMVLQLVREKLLPLPTLFVSGYLDHHRSEYYKLLRNITAQGDWTPYLRFMLVAFAEQAEETRNLLLAIRGLYFSTKRILKKRFSRIYSVELLDALFSTPIISPVRLSEIIGTHYATASKYLQQLAKAGYLRERWVGKYHLYANTQLVKVFSMPRLAIRHGRGKSNAGQDRKTA